MFPAICSLAGIIAGMFGLGGAVVKVGQSNLLVYNVYSQSVYTFTSCITSHTKTAIVHPVFETALLPIFGLGSKVLSRF